MEKSGNKKFLKMPTLGSEKGLLKKIIKENIQYPEQAKENNIEGDVILSYKVNNQGEVTECKIIKSLGYGCDEEAIRLVKILKYEAVKNRGVKVTTNNRIKIPFRLDKNSINAIEITYTTKKTQQESNSGKEENTSYNYTIPL
jgi:TonB family protein